MVYLLAVSLLWAFSFGLIGNRLAGIDPFFVAAVRTGLAAVVFLPFIRPWRLFPVQIFELAACGALQFGLMYLAYISAFSFIPSHLVALFSITTPLYVVLFCDLGLRRFHPVFLLAALLSVAGAAVIRAGDGFDGWLWAGFGLMQVAGLAFAGGQVWYRGWRQRHPGGSDRELMGWLYLGAFVLTGAASLFASPPERTWPEPGEWTVLLYLGVAASGVGFFLWNKGAVLARPATLAACNNALIPLGMLVSLFVFGEAESLGRGQIVRLAAGTLLIAAAIVVGERGGEGDRRRVPEEEAGR